MIAFISLSRQASIYNMIALILMSIARQINIKQSLVFYAIYRWFEGLP